MCDTIRSSSSARTIPRPRWRLLYGLTALGLAALVAAEVLLSAGTTRTVLQCGLAIGVFAVMALWVRLNRVALGVEDWCNCADAKISVRLIRSGLAPGWADDNRRWCDLLHRSIWAEPCEEEPAAIAPKGPAVPAPVRPSEVAEAETWAVSSAQR